MSEQKRIGFPCRFLQINPNGYHTCEILNAKKGETSTILCAIFGCQLPMSFPVAESDVRKICPCGYEFEKIEDKMRLLER